MSAAGQGTPPRAVAILPARLASVRLPRKVLLAETGLPLFVHSARNVARATSIQRVVVATDSEEVLRAGQEADIEVLMTSPQHPSGSDRVQEAFELLHQDYDVVLNVQADEPDVDPADLDSLVSAFRDPALEAATLAAPIEDASDLACESVVKVVRAASGDALYFSRSPLPNSVHARGGSTPARALRHVGVYAFRPAALRRFCALDVGQLESTENLEQLRWLEAGERMRVIDARHAPHGIDTADDYQKFVQRVALADAIPDLERTEPR